jgi:hypothetical protein
MRDVLVTHSMSCHHSCLRNVLDQGLLYVLLEAMPILSYTMSSVSFKSENAKLRKLPVLHAKYSLFAYQT